MVRQSRTTNYYKPNVAKTATFSTIDDDVLGFMIAPTHSASQDFFFEWQQANRNWKNIFGSVFTSPKGFSEIDAKYDPQAFA